MSAAVIVTLAGLLTANRSGQPFRVCDIPCCVVAPSCAEALSVNCSCSDTQEVYVREGDIPASVESILISRTKNVVISKKALYDFKSLKTLTVMGIETLRIDSEGLAGNWLDEAIVSIEDIGTLTVVQYAFSFSSQKLGPRLALRNVAKLSAGPSSFAGAFAHLSMARVRMTSCRGETFGGRIYHLELVGVTIEQLEQACVNAAARRAWALLTIRSSNLTFIQSLAFNGSIKEIRIDHLHTSVMQRSGFQLSVKKLRINTAFIGDLRNGSLDVLASGAIWIDNTTVHMLGGGAMARLRVKASASAHAPLLFLRELHIGRAEAGSLQFAADTHVCLDGLQVDQPQECPSAALARRLVAGGAAGQHSQAERQVLRQLLGRGRCATDARTSAEIAGHDHRCALVTGRRNQRVPQTAVALLASLAVVVLLALALALAVLLRRRRAAQGLTKTAAHRSPPRAGGTQDGGSGHGRDARRARPGAAGVTNAETPVYAEVARSRQRTPRVDVPVTAGWHWRTSYAAANEAPPLPPVSSQRELPLEDGSGSSSHLLFPELASHDGVPEEDDSGYAAVGGELIGGRA
ncbi:uncharacterized protein LOC119090370 [Pollicipes pollicipes]|uniref:uncharacterized protein LOC119090370 n=1 Tax=Pollicipes pollicipes TaxID=41117 RepID=UPI001884BE38|nr:uncharacterized protein LOC119090370 [Pollicipes pollicipes]